MSRIRSVHPEQWTDEDFVTCSPLARLLAIAVRNECDDRGVFEWKPVSLKMRVLPADNCDMAALLSELVTKRQIGRFEVEGRKYGFVRNFQRYQRPKKPQFKYPQPPEWVEPTTPSSASGSEPDDDQGGGGGEPEASQVGGNSVSGGIAVADGGKEERRVGKEEKEKTAVGGAEYAFSGKIIRLTPENLEAWQKAYGSLLDLSAELQRLDDFYDRTLAGKDRRNWFIRASAALNKQHQAARESAAAATVVGQKRAGGFVPLGVGG